MDGLRQSTVFFRRIGLPVILALGLLSAPHVAETQQARKVARIGYLSNSSGGAPLDVEFSKALRDLGWVEGRDVIVEGRYSSGKSGQFPSFAADLVQLGVDVIVGWGPAPVAAARNATKAIPIVMILNSDPVAAGFVTSIPRPGANITGVALIDDPGGKRIQLLKEILPRLTRVGILLNPERPGVEDLVRDTKRSADAMGLRLEIFHASGPSDFDRAFSDMKRARVGAVVVFTDSMYWAHRSDIVAQAARSGLPTIHSNRDFVDAGALLSYAVDFHDLARRAAGYVDTHWPAVVKRQLLILPQHRVVSHML